MVVLRLLGLLLDLLLLPLRAFRRRRAIADGAWLTVTVDGPVQDLVPRQRSLLRFVQARPQPKALSLHALDDVVTALLADARVRGLVVSMRSFSGGMGAATSLRNVLARVRAGGKQVVVHLPMGGDSKEMYVASVATKVLLAPTAQLAPFGFRSSALYFKTALDKLGVEPQVFACGEFKSAGETLVRDSMSAPQRAQVERLVETFHGALVDAIAEGRGVAKERAAALIDEAPYFGPAGVTAGLADDVAYEDEVPGKLGAKHEDLVDAFAYRTRVRRPLLRPVGRAPVIAVIPVHGAITHGTGAFGAVSTDERVGRMVRAARKDRRVRGVILHVDSPGGSALASDRMHHELVQLAREKPLVCCMANVAASGGYYVAAPARVIVAEPTTVTGSIGVVAARMSLDPLLTKLGITREAVERGARAQLLAPVGDLDADARAAVARELDATYQAFLGVVAAGRKLDVAAVDKLARGRVYTGADAHAAGLIDVLGGFATALNEVRKLLPADATARAEVTLLQTPSRPVPALEPPTAALAALLPPALRLWLDLREDRVLALAPFIET